MMVVAPLAPNGTAVIEYDRRFLATYAELIDAAGAGTDWRIVVRDALGLDPDEVGAEACWRSHLDRARWIIGDGLGPAITAFGRIDSRSDC